MTPTRYEHIVLDEHGTPWIAGTTMKVIELVLEQSAYGWSADELHFQHPTRSLGQISSALAYYRDHTDDLDQEIARRLAAVDALQQNQEPLPVLVRLRATRSGAVE